MSPELAAALVAVAIAVARELLVWLDRRRRQRGELRTRRGDPGTEQQER